MYTCGAHFLIMCMQVSCAILHHHLIAEAKIYTVYLSNTVHQTFYCFVHAGFLLVQIFSCIKKGTYTDLRVFKMSQQLVQCTVYYEKHTSNSKCLQINFQHGNKTLIEIKLCSAAYCVLQLLKMFLTTLQTEKKQDGVLVKKHLIFFNSLL